MGWKNSATSPTSALNAAAPIKQPTARKRGTHQPAALYAEEITQQTTEAANTTAS
jgi:hypothetical protein